MKFSGPEKPMNPAQKAKAKQFYERKQVADQIRAAREGEKNDSHYSRDRTGEDLLRGLGGLKNLFEYVRKLKSQVVLDIGTGSGQAIDEISKYPFA